MRAKEAKEKMQHQAFIDRIIHTDKSCIIIDQKQSEKGGVYSVLFTQFGRVLVIDLFAK